MRGEEKRPRGEETQRQTHTEKETLKCNSFCNKTAADILMSDRNKLEPNHKQIHLIELNKPKSV